MLPFVLALFLLADEPVGHFPDIEVDAQKRQVRIECQALRCEAPLEFFCVVAGTNEHESVIRTKAKPSQIHTALLMLGLTPGGPIKYSETEQSWSPPHGPPLNISVEFTSDGKRIVMPACKLIREIRTKQPMNETTWVFAGSRIMPDGVYAADVTGYVVSVVNFDLTVIDVPELASSSNETLQWESNLDVLPPLGTPMTMIIEPAESPATQPSTAPTTQASR